MPEDPQQTLSFADAYAADVAKSKAPAAPKAPLSFADAYDKDVAGDPSRQGKPASAYIPSIKPQDAEASAQQGVRDGEEANPAPSPQAGQGPVPPAPAFNPADPLKLADIFGKPGKPGKPSDMLPHPDEVNQVTSASAHVITQLAISKIREEENLKRQPQPIDTARLGTQGYFPNVRPDTPAWVPPRDQPQLAARRPGAVEQILDTVRQGPIGRAFHISPETQQAIHENGDQLLNFSAALPPGTGPGILRSTTEFLSGLSTPSNLLMMAGSGGLGAMEKQLGKTGAAKLLSLGFSSQMLWDSLKQTPQFAQAARSGDWATARGILTKQVLGAAMAALGVKHGMSADVTPPEATPKMVRSALAPVPINRAERRASVAVPETGVPESVARTQAAHEDIARNYGGKPLDQMTPKERNAVDALAAEGNTGTFAQAYAADKKENPNVRTATPAPGARQDAAQAKGPQAPGQKVASSPRPGAQPRPVRATQRGGKSPVVQGRPGAAPPAAPAQVGANAKSESPVPGNHPPQGTRSREPGGPHQALLPGNGHQPVRGPGPVGSGPGHSEPAGGGDSGKDSRRLVTGSVDKPLTARGREQGKELAGRVGPNAMVLTAPNDRSLETGLAVSPKAKGVSWAAPWAMGVHEGKEAAIERPAINDRIQNHPKESTGVSAHSGTPGESFDIFRQRLIRGLQAARSGLGKDQTLVVVTSGRALQVVDAWAHNGQPPSRAVDVAHLTETGEKGEFSKPGKLFKLEANGLKPVERVTGPGIYFAPHGETEWNGSQSVGHKPQSGFVTVPPVTTHATAPALIPKAEAPPRGDITTDRLPESAAVRASATRQVENDPEGLLARYTQRFGNVFNADNAAELFPEYAASNESRTKFRTAVHPAAQWLRDELFRRALADPEIKQVVFTAGGNGAGKSLGALQGGLVMDTTLSNPEHSGRLVQAALDAGKRVEVVYTYRPIEEAFQGVLDRALTEGRTVSVGTLISTHEGAAKTVSRLVQEYEGTPNVRFRFVDNSGTEAKPGTLALTEKQDYRGSRDALYAILESQRSRLPAAVYEAAQGVDYRRGSGPTAAAGHRQPEPAPPGEGSPPSQPVVAPNEVKNPEKGGARLNVVSLGLAKLVERDIAPLAAKAASAIAESTHDILRIVAPQIRSSAAREGSLTLRHKMSSMARAYDQAEAALRDAKKLFDKLPAAFNYEFIRRVENHLPQTTPELETIAKTLRALLDSRRQQVQALGTGKLQKFYQDYFPHIWDDPKKAASVFASIFGRRPLEGGKAFLKQRTHLTFEDGLAKGLKPVSYNPVDLVLLKTREMDRYILAHEYLNERKAAHAIQFVDARTGKARKGWKQIVDPIGTVYGQSVQQIAEYPNAGIWEGLQQVANALGIKQERGFLNLHGAIGRASRAGRVQTLHGTAEDVLAHEIGHQIDFIAGSGKHFVPEYPDPQSVGGLRDRYRAMKATAKTAGNLKAVQDQLKLLQSAVRKQQAINKELRALADVRTKAGGHSKAYTHKREEKMAQLAEMWVGSRELFQRTAPTVFREWKAFLDANPKLHALRDIEGNTEVEPIQQPYDVGGLVVKGHYYAEEGEAQLLNNHLGPGLRNKAAFKAALGLNNVMNQWQLGLSARHLMFATIDAATSKGALAIEQALRGRPLAALKSAAQVPVSPITAFLTGLKMSREWFAPGSQGAAMGELVKGWEMGGGRARMDEFYETHIKERMVREFRAGNYWGGLARAPLATVEGISNMMMKGIIPKLKMGVGADLIRLEMERMGPNRNTTYIRQKMSEISNSIDNRMGQMTYDNLFWNRTFKDVAMLTVRSVGWNLGTLRELGGAATDVVRIPIQLARGQVKYEDVNLHRVSYAVSLAVTAAVMGAIYQYLATGKGPQELKDYYFPRNGDLDEAGRPQRMSFPIYTGDVYKMATEPLRTVTNKASPLLSLLSEEWKNEDFFHTKIREQDDNVGRQVLDSLKFAAEQFNPLSVRSFQRETKLQASPGQRLQSFVGISSAPSSLEQAGAERLAADLARAHAPAGSRTREQAAHREATSTISHLARTGKPYAAEVRKDLDAGVITREQAHKAIHEAHLAPLALKFKSLELPDALRVWAAATPAERRMLRGEMLKKRANLRTKPRAERMVLEPRVERALATQ